MMNTVISKRFLYLVLAAAVATFLLMVAGNAVRVFDAAGACPDWPTCFGSFAPPVGVTLAEPLGVQIAHRVLAGLASVLVGAAAVWALLSARMRAVRWVTVPLAASALIMLAQSLLGSGLVGEREGILLSVSHTALALLALGLLVVSLAAVFHLRSGAAKPVFRAPAFHAPFAQLSLVTLAALFALLLSGTLVTATGAGAACSGWPLCDGGLPQTGLGWLAIAHRVVVLITAGLVATQFTRAWKGQRSQPAQLTAATAALLLLLGQVYVGGIIATRNFPLDLIGLHAAASAGLWAAQIIVAISAGFANRTAAEEAEEAREPLPIRRRIKDFVILSKPIIVLLLLVTTYAGMVVGGKVIPSLELTIWTMIGGALAAGGSSALNQFIDRDTDKAMQRTAKRPLPDQRLKPAEGLAYGVGACIAAFFLMAGQVNLISAVLSFAGMVYYVLIYSVWLKHATVQNIVIGGGAGAIPPLVGWAAATGSLNVPALFLFAIIFFWTPPHFWALAYVRRSDYARGKVPMLPVIRGEVETRRQIWIYTLELVALTLLLPLFDMAGTVYLIAALALGLWLIATAWRLYKEGGNKLAWKMYRYSSMYLAFLMLAMVVDVLV